MSYTTKLFSGVGVALAIVIAAASAQNLSVLKADVPFDFYAGGATLAAGEYAVLQDPGSGAMRIQDSHTRRSVIALCRPGHMRRVPSESKLTFHRYGREYFLESVSVAGVSYSSDLLPSRMERQVTRGAARPDVLMVPAVR